MNIRDYQSVDSKQLFTLMKEEGEEWTYQQPKEQPKYIRALENSIVYVAIEDNQICGYIRCKEDDGFGIYILDLLISKQYRGRNYGRQLINKVCDCFPDETVYVTSDADPYYEKQGYEKVGTIFQVSI